MFNSDDFTTEATQTQFTISYELLCLLQWLLEHNEESLRRIITSAVQAGLDREIEKQTKGLQVAPMEEMQHNIVDFLGLLEGLLYDVMNEQVKKKAREQDLLPAIEHIDTNECDESTVQFSVEQATASFADNPDVNPKELLYKELLKRWKPNKKNIKN